MKKSGFSLRISKKLDKTVDYFYDSDIKQRKWTIAIILLAFFGATFLINLIARQSPDTMINFIGIQVPFTIFTGVFSSIANISIVFLVVFHKRLGYYMAIIIVAIQLPVLCINLFVHKLPSSIPGIFNDFFIFIACSIIFINNSIIEKYQTKMHEQAVTDSLTNLPNRFACTKYIEHLIRHNTPFVLVSIDLNNFKSINDTMGHDVGNQVLVEIANRWKELAESKKTHTKDFVYRLGGDEFAIIIRNYELKSDILNTINAYKRILEQTITIDDCDYFMGACFGCAEYPIDAKTASNLFSCADAAMHKVKKQNGSNSILRYTSDLLETEKSLEIERKIRTALANDAVFFNLQPQFDMNRKLRGFEALARIRDTDGKVLKPTEFISVAEKTGLIDHIDVCVFTKASTFLVDVLKNEKADITLSFNISVKHLMKNTFIDNIRTVIKTTQIPPKNLELEITESIMIDSAEKALNRINEIKQMGIKVAIDDFGTGYSSLSYLNKLPSDMLKIDKSFIDAMNKNDSSKQYVSAIVSIGHILNLKVISEGVEHADQLETLRNIGCDYIQGFIWGKPLEPEEALELIRAQ